MEMTPSSTPAKRTRAKAPTNASTPTVVIKTKKPRVARKQVTEPEVVAADLVAVPASEEDTAALIATTAYYLAAERNFAPGHELDDWLEAERRVRARTL